MTHTFVSKGLCNNRPLLLSHPIETDQCVEFVEGNDLVQPVVGTSVLLQPSPTALFNAHAVAYTVDLGKPRR